jgi:hypothetical protein
VKPFFIALVAGARPNFMKIAPSPWPPGRPHLVFVEAGWTSARDVERVLRLLPQEKILGLVLNRHKPTKKDATYYPAYYPKK